MLWVYCIYTQPTKLRPYLQPHHPPSPRNHITSSKPIRQLVPVSKMHFSSILLPLLASTVLSIPTAIDDNVDTQGSLNTTDVLPRSTTKGNMAGIAITAFPGNGCRGKGIPYPDIQYGYSYPATILTFQVSRVLKAGERLSFSAYNGNGNCKNGRYTESVQTHMGPGCYGVNTVAACFRLTH